MGSVSLPALDSLNLAGDGDDGDLIIALERSFGVEFGETTRDWFTVGDIYDALLARLPTAEEAGKCAGSMAFYRVRAALGRISPEARRISPGTRLHDLGLPPPKVFLRRLRAELGLNRLADWASWWGVVGALAVVIGFFGSIGVLVARVVDVGWPVLLLGPLGMVMCWTDRGTYAERTVGDLAREVATNNFAMLAQAGADRRPQAVWRTLCEIVADSPDLDVDPARIAPGTRLIAGR